MSRPARILPALLFGVTVACFLAALGNGFAGSWDDDLNLTTNVAYRGFSGRHLHWMFTTIHGGHYQPLTWLTFALDHALWGMDPRGYHLTSILLHATNAVLFYWLVRALLREAHRSDGVALRLSAAGGAAFFAIHPLRVESVAWATERRDVLSGLFLLLTVLAYLRMARSEARLPWLLVSLGCFTLSLLSKAWGITLPAVLLLLDAYPLRRLHTRTGAVLLEKVPYALLAAAAALGTARAASVVPLLRTLEQHGIAERIAQAAYALCFYVGKTVFPVALSPLYPLERPLDPSAPRYLASIALVLASTAVLLALRRRWPWALAAAACYAIIASPVLGFVQVGPQVAADRYTYLACLPWAVLVAAGLYAAGSRGHAIWATAAGVLVLAALGALTVRQTRVWRDAVALWEHAIALDPDNASAYVNRGWARQQLRGDIFGAIIDYGTALRLDPSDALAWNDRGQARQRLGDLDGAIQDYTNAIRHHPGYASATYNRGTAWQAKKNRTAAIADFTEAIRLRPMEPRPYNNRGNLRLAEGDVDGALADFSDAVRVDPRFTLGWINRASARRRQGDVPGAIADYQAALAAAPPGWSGCRGVRKALEELGVAAAALPSCE